ncbi:hypothetical protein EVAR_62485_1 [Eumeta japonica]|uniref:Uncharacterized protein n=1 Tax=Eumeta variegata TaxID=151549 RepID=A0A4C1ZJP6_EUMVA|nr:hypothetical protein EVAR_62485_1 [Eumeta japonica]
MQPTFHRRFFCRPATLADVDIYSCAVPRRAPPAGRRSHVKLGLSAANFTSSVNKNSSIYCGNCLNVRSAQNAWRPPAARARRGWRFEIGRKSLSKPGRGQARVARASPHALIGYLYPRRDVAADVLFCRLTCRSAHRLKQNSTVRADLATKGRTRLAQAKVIAYHRRRRRSVPQTADAALWRVRSTHRLRRLLLRIAQPRHAAVTMRELNVVMSVSSGLTRSDRRGSTGGRVRRFYSSVNIRAASLLANAASVRSPRIGTRYGDVTDVVHPARNATLFRLSVHLTAGRRSVLRLLRLGVVVVHCGSGAGAAGVCRAFFEFLERWSSFRIRCARSFCRSVSLTPAVCEPKGLVLVEFCRCAPSVKVILTSQQYSFDRFKLHICRGTVITPAPEARATSRASGAALARGRCRIDNGKGTSIPGLQCLHLSQRWNKWTVHVLWLFSLYVDKVSTIEKSRVWIKNGREPKPVVTGDAQGASGKLRRKKPVVLKTQRESSERETSVDSDKEKRRYSDILDMKASLVSNSHTSRRRPPGQGTPAGARARSLVDLLVEKQNEKKRAGGEWEIRSEWMKNGKNRKEKREERKRERERWNRE